jgi:glucuronate isomerase
MLRQHKTLRLDADRCFSPEAGQRKAARDLYGLVKDLPLVCPHGHVDPRLLADADASFGTPAEMLVVPDHYVFRMLYSQGVSLEDLGVPAMGPEGKASGVQVEQDHRAIWQRFAERFYLFRGTPTGTWLNSELSEVFGINRKLNAENGQAIYDELAARIAQPEFRPRAMFERFKIEVLCTTDGASDSLAFHRRINESPWGTNPATGAPRVRPTFRPDKAVNILAPDWRDEIDTLGQLVGGELTTYASLVRALEERRAFFREMGAKATDHAALTAYTGELASSELEAIYGRALRGVATEEDARRFTGHMLIEMARMSTEDGLVMQLHVGSLRGINRPLTARFGADKGADIPVATEWTQNLRPLLDRFGNDRRLTLILFCLDESTYARELAPLADSFNGMRRYFDQVMETAGLHNTAGFNDDTRAFPSIPARHDLWRRAACDWIAGLLVRGLIDDEDAGEMAKDCAYRLVKQAYGL